MKDKKGFAPEIVAGAFGVATSIALPFMPIPVNGVWTSISFETGLILGFVSASLAFTVSLIKAGMRSHYSKLKAEYIPTIEFTQKILELLSRADGRRLELLNLEVERASEAAESIVQLGRVNISPVQYYEALHSYTSQLQPGDEIIATSLLGAQWGENQNALQKNYEEVHNQAMAAGVKITRVFIVEKGLVGHEDHATGQMTAYAQMLDDRIATYLCWKASAQNVKADIDVVIFKFKDRTSRNGGTKRVALKARPHPEYIDFVEDAEEYFEEGDVGRAEIDQLEQKVSSLIKRKATREEFEATLKLIKSKNGKP